MTWVYGCVNQAGEDNRNVARMAGLLAGLPGRGGGHHGEPAVRLGPRGGRSRCPRREARRSRHDDRGGVEGMTRSPYVMGKPKVRSTAR